MSEYFPGKVIKKYRELKGWSQQKLAEHWPKKNGEIGVEWHYVQKVEYGISNVVDQPVLRKLSDLLGIPLWEFGYAEHDPYSAVKDPSDLELEYDGQTQSDQVSVAQSSTPSDTDQDTSLRDTAYEEAIKELSLLDTTEGTQNISTSTSFLVRVSSSGAIGNSAGLWADDLLAIYTRGIAACQDLYFSGSPHQVEALLPLYCNQTALLADHPSPIQQSAAKLASQAQQLACELLCNREDFRAAQQAGQRAFSYAQQASDSNLQVASLIGLANIGFHQANLQRKNPRLYRKLSYVALQTYKHAVSLLNEKVTPLLKGRTYAGITEVHAMRGELQQAMQTMGLAYQHYPANPENDPAYPYLRASRYSLYVFGDAQSRLFLGQPKEASNALIAMEKETNDPQIEPITKLDLLYYRAEVHSQQDELEASMKILTEATLLTRTLGSQLYFNKLTSSYYELLERWPREASLVALEEVFHW